MKNQIKLFILALISVVNLNAQNAVKPEIALELDAMNVFFAGLQNPLEIAYSGATANQLEVESDIGTLKKDSLGNYFIDIPFDQVSKLANVNVFLKKEKEPRKLIDTKQFRIFAVPQPKAYFGSKSGGDIAFGEVMLVNFISVRLDDFNFEDLKFTVHKYTLTFTPKSGIPRKFICNSADIAQEMNAVIDSMMEQKYINEPAIIPEMKRILINSKTGDKILISDIWASFPEGDVVKLNKNIDLTVK